MAFFSLEHSKAAYLTDFILYGIAVTCLLIFLTLSTPLRKLAEVVIFVLAGLFTSTFIEYFLHRFILHGLQPFKRWHALHHARPSALIGTPTILSLTLIVILVFTPAILLGNLLRACALTLGLTGGYLFYTITHHATHHWKANHSWLKERKIWHARHHHVDAHPVCFGVSTGFWDEVFCSNGRK
jgi:sterol desaturase/sphingolipid hydroxylase (fatty acid hydroxylase superfamily)